MVGFELKLWYQREDCGVLVFNKLISLKVLVIHTDSATQVTELIFINISQGQKNTGIHSETY